MSARHTCRPATAVCQGVAHRQCAACVGSGSAGSSEYKRWRLQQGVAEGDQEIPAGRQCCCTTVAAHTMASPLLASPLLASTITAASPAVLPTALAYPAAHRRALACMHACMWQAAHQPMLGPDTACSCAPAMMRCCDAYHTPAPSSPTQVAPVLLPNRQGPPTGVQPGRAQRRQLHQGVLHRAGAQLIHALQGNNPEEAHAGAAAGRLHRWGDSVWQALLCCAVLWLHHAV